MANLDWVLVCKEVDDLECMCNDADGQQFLSVVATLHHKTKGVYSHYDLCCSNIITNLSTSRSTIGI
jgi:hypothetical protein